MGDTNSLAYLKQRLKLLLPQKAAKKLFDERREFTEQVDLSGARVRLTNRKTYRYDVNEKECLIYGSPGSIHIVLMEIVRIIKHVGVVIKVPTREVKIMDSVHHLKFIVNSRVAARLISGYQTMMQDICCDEATSIAICEFENRPTPDRCIIIYGKSESLLKVSMFILHVIIECSKPYMDKLKACLKSKDVWDNYHQRIDNFRTRHYVLKNFGDTAYKYCSDGVYITYSQLCDAGYSEDYIKALNFAALVEAGKPTTSQLDLRFKFILNVKDRTAQDKIAGRVRAGPLYIPGSVGNPV